MMTAAAMDERALVAKLGGGGRVSDFGVWLAAAMLVFAPLVRGGNRPVAQLVLEIGALGLLAVAILQRESIARLSGPVRAALLLMAVWPLLQLLPLPFEWWAALPGRGDAARALRETGATPAWMQVTLSSSDSERAVWALLPPFMTFIFIVGLEARHVRRLVGVFVAVAVFQALLGLFQYGGGEDSLLRFRYGHYADSAIGTFANRNHLAGMLDMALPVALAMLAAGIFRMERGSGHRHGGVVGRLRMLAGAGLRANSAALWAGVCVVLLLGIVFARSRMGIAVCIVGLVLTALGLLRNFGGGFATRTIAVVISLAVVGAVAVGLGPVLARFSVDASADARWPNLVTTLELAWRFFPLGSGPGTFVEAFSGAHPDAIVGDYYVNHAHNDYAEWLLEGGAPAALLLLLVVGMFFVRWRRVWAVRSWESLHVMQVGAGVGLLVLALFGLTDYNLRIPANQIYFALLAAVFFHPGEPAAVRKGARRMAPATSEERRVTNGQLAAVKASVGAWDELPVGNKPAGAERQPPVERNPFME